MAAYVDVMADSTTADVPHVIPATQDAFALYLAISPPPDNHNTAIVARVIAWALLVEGEDRKPRWAGVYLNARTLQPEFGPPSTIYFPLREAAEVAQKQAQKSLDSGGGDQPTVPEQE